MKKIYIFSFLIVLFSAVLLTGCGKQFYITVIQDTPEYSIQIKEANSDRDVTYYEGEGYKVKAGKTVDVFVDFKEGWDPNKAKLFAGDTELTLTKSTHYNVDNIMVAQLKVNSNIEIEVRNLAKFVYTLKLPTQHRDKYTLYNKNMVITDESVMVNHGDSFTLTVAPISSRYILPQYLLYDLGDSFDFLDSENNGHYGCSPVTDLYGRAVFTDGEGLNYKFSNITQNIAIELFSQNNSILKTINLNLANNSEYSLSAYVYKGHINGETGDPESRYDPVNDGNIYGEDLYINFDEIASSDYVKNLTNQTIIVKGANGTEDEFAKITEGLHAGYFCIPSYRVITDLTISLKEKAIDDANLGDTYYGTFNNQISEKIPNKFIFTKGNIYPPECYTYGDKVYLEVGDTLFINRQMYGDNFTLTGEGITFDRELFKENETFDEPNNIKFTVSNISGNDFKIELTSSVVVSVPYSDLKDKYKIEYRIGYDENIEFTEITDASGASITVNNHEALVIRLTDKNGENAWANFNLSKDAWFLLHGNYFSLNYLYCNIENGIGANQIYPENGIYDYVVAWFVGNTDITE